MSKTIISLVIIIAFGSFCISASIEEEKYTTIPYYKGILNGDFHIKIEGRFNGSIEGSYKSNQKVGDWILYNNKGKVVQERTYTNNFTYTIEESNEAKSIFELKRNKLGVYEYFNANEKNVVFSKRIWKIADEYNFPYAQAILRAFSEVDITKTNIYTSSELKKKHSLKKDKPLDLSQAINIKIMGDYFYDSQRKLSEFRILAISLLFEDSETEYWFYYPDLRVTFGNTLIENKNRMIENLDDLFFFDAYPYLIYKVENINDTLLNQNDLKNQTIDILNELLAEEINLWVSKEN